MDSFTIAGVGFAVLAFVFFCLALFVAYDMVKQILRK